MENTEPIGFLERLGTAVYSFRAWLTKMRKLTVVMAKGGYIVNERKRLFIKLGEEVYYKISRGEMRSADLDPIVEQLDRLTRKVEVEELLVRHIRFGKQSGKRSGSFTQDNEDEGDLTS